MAKGGHEIGTKGKFFQLKLKSSYSPIPRDLMLDRKTYSPNLPYFTPPCILLMCLTQVLIVSVNKKEAGHTPVSLRNMLWVDLFFCLYPILSDLYLLVLEVSKYGNEVPISSSKLKAWKITLIQQNQKKVHASFWPCNPQIWRTVIY